MNNPRANTFDYNSLYALGAAVSIVETKTDVRGLVLQSAVDGFFSGGFRLPIFHQITHAEFMRLWVLGKSIFRRIHALPVPSVAAIDGHALGLGCALALACQFRFMVHRAESAKRTGLFGLNEVAVGLPVPEWLAARFRDLTTPRAAEDLLAIGATLPADRACKIGIIDRVFGSADDMHGSILADLEKRVAVPKEAQAQTISLLRRDYLDYFDACYERDNEQIWTALSSQSTQEAVASALAKLKAKRESKPSGETK
ncbi:hypothetical protein GGI25_001116 [Coemansia spiralis]|uniref:Enoyl-CoA hydratase n=2 Tax=Coemansia TaxID=4863 RepID=A0A9W8GBI4_9FUNG|nr:hypothetical protein EDC05_000786 [Coemansia umbellata]KAJ2625120.1 hypothetical protein GGI26_000923 [Coemansia sp. RSA 1358]KAJ2679927.1 hypothetical protein GGI25_001116 [Coemansia spiralis]